MKEPKLLYETILNRVVEQENKEEKEDNGSKIVTTKMVKVLKPITIAILKPDRKLFKTAEMFYARTLSEYLKGGLLPYSLVAKRYANDGGPLTEEEKVRLSALRVEATQLETEFFSKMTDTDEKNQARKNEILARITKLNAEVGNIQNAYADIFDNTAEIKARNDTIEWWVLNLSLMKDKEEFQFVFGEGDLETRMAKMDEMEEKEDEFFLELIKRLSYLISFWFTSRSTLSKIDFSVMEKLYLDTVSTYHPSVEPTIKIEEVPPTTPPPPPPPPTPVVNEIVALPDHGRDHSTP